MPEFNTIRRRRPQVKPTERDYHAPCLCGCKKRLQGNQVYYNSACRKRVQRERDRQEQLFEFMPPRPRS